ncbi:hypothetical protein [Shewanella gelidii]|nr:hypothetical protein [Shewanella gelidii]MCL1098958.1 hypothetical protein [Shewanella gelidii]
MPRLKKLALFSLVATAIFSVWVIEQVWMLYSTKFVTIDAHLKEISGIEFDKNQRLWAINDGGDLAQLHQINKDGSIARSIHISNAKNLDWEDMTQDDFGHFFIGDFGNNSNNRDWLTIYKIENPIDIKTTTTTAEIIKFTNPEATRSTTVEHQHYDLEAFVYYQNSLYLFSKNRSKPFDGKTRLYRIGDHAANFQAQYVSEFTTCTSMKHLCWITSAALSPDRSKLILLDSQRLWLFENWQGDDFFSGNAYQINLGIVTQKEAVTFYDDNTIIFTDEEFKGIGRNAYVLKLDDVKKKRVK